MHACLSNGHWNLWSNFNYKKLLKSETSSCVIARVGLKGGQNSLEHCKIWHAHLYINRASKSTIKFQFWEFGQKWNSIMQFRLKEGKRALNITKFGMHSYLPNGHLNIWSYFNSKKLAKRETLSCAFNKVALKGSEIARMVVNVSVYACLLKWVPKSTFKFHFF